MNMNSFSMLFFSVSSLGPRIVGRRFQSILTSLSASLHSMIDTEFTIGICVHCEFVSTGRFK